MTTPDKGNTEKTFRETIEKILRDECRFFNFDGWICRDSGPCEICKTQTDQIIKAVETEFKNYNEATERAYIELTDAFGHHSEHCDWCKSRLERAKRFLLSKNEFLRKLGERE